MSTRFFYKLKRIDLYNVLLSQIATKAIERDHRVFFLFRDIGKNGLHIAIATEHFSVSVIIEYPKIGNAEIPSICYKAMVEPEDFYSFVREFSYECIKGSIKSINFDENKIVIENMGGACYSWSAVNFELAYKICCVPKEAVMAPIPLIMTRFDFDNLASIAKEIFEKYEINFIEKKY